MADPKRLVDRLGSSFERELLRAAGSERAPLAARERVQARLLGATAAVTAASTLAAAGSSGTKSGSALVLVLKWLGIGALAGSATMLAGSELASFGTNARRSPGPAVTARAASPSEWPIPPPVPRATTETAPAVSRDAPPASSAPAGGKRAVGDVQIGTSSTLLEAESMRRIRSEAAHDPAFAERLLRQHLARFPNGAHAGEATRLLEKLSATSSRDPN